MMVDYEIIRSDRDCLGQMVGNLEEDKRFMAEEIDLLKEENKRLKEENEELAQSIVSINDLQSLRLSRLKEEIEDLKDEIIVRGER